MCTRVNSAPAEQSTSGPPAEQPISGQEPPSSNEQICNDSQIACYLKSHLIGNAKQVISNFSLLEKRRITVNGLRKKLNEKEMGVELSYKQTQEILFNSGHR